MGAGEAWWGIVPWHALCKVKSTLAIAAVLSLLFAGIVFAPSTSSATPSPTFDFLNVPGDNATIEEAYSWLNEGGTIMVAPGTHLVSLSIQRHVHIVSAGGAESTILRPRHGNMFSVNTACTISGFTAYGNGTNFVATADSAEDVVVTDNVIINASVLGRGQGFVFTGNNVDGRNAYRYLHLDGDEGLAKQNVFTNGLEIRIEGENCSFSENDLEGCGVRINGDHNTVSKNDFQGSGPFDWGIISSARFTQIANNTFQDCETCLDSDGFFEVVADNVASNCSWGFDLDSPGEIVEDRSQQPLGLPRPNLHQQPRLRPDKG